ncbi:hypothetical protein DPMN_057070 [Dreissena polymorpha]|uniref:Uncharacterized protein n=1 Tax=Dreissena polymorpha TaxID=45954 RepID=A0A9D4HU73_DREPO|nr:hypothetical protein DPMN_057070 [Dreissena polymorpha]
MATVRQYDGDNAIERWRHCDDTTATVRYDYRIVAPMLMMAVVLNLKPLHRRFRPKLVQIMTVYPKTKPTCMIKELILNRMLNVIRIEMFIWLRYPFIHLGGEEPAWD